MNKYLKAILCLTAAIILLLNTMLPAPASAEQKSKHGILTDYEIRLIGDKSTWNAYPAIIVGTTDYGDHYNSDMVEYSFPDLKFKMPSMAGEDSEWSYKGDGSKFQWRYFVSDYYYKKGNHLYVHISYPVDEKQYDYLYDFDEKNKTMKLVKKVLSNNHYFNMEVYPESGMFSVRTSRDRNNLDIYNINSGKLITTASGAYEPYPLMHGSGARVYTRKPASNSLIIGVDVDKKGKDTDGSSFIYSGTDIFELSLDGTKKAIDYNELNFRDAESGWSYKAGNIVYGSYYDKNSKTWLVGYKSGSSKSYTPLSQKGNDPQVEFSPSLKYMIITEFKIDPKTGKNTNEYKTRIVDAKTAKVLRVLPAYNRNYVHFLYQWKYGDELVEVFYDERARAGYLNLSSGIFTSKYEEWVHTYGSYSGDFGELLSPEISPHIMVNDTLTVTLSAPGAFLGGNYLWYVGVTEFAKAVGANVSVSNKTITVKLGEKSLVVDPETAITFRNRTYIPIKEFRKLGLKLQLNAGEELYRYKYDKY